jgi:hypothetical protein
MRHLMLLLLCLFVSCDWSLHFNDDVEPEPKPVDSSDKTAILLKNPTELLINVDLEEAAGKSGPWAVVKPKSEVTKEMSSPFNPYNEGTIFYLSYLLIVGDILLPLENTDIIHKPLVKGSTNTVVLKAPSKALQTKYLVLILRNESNATDIYVERNGEPVYPLNKQVKWIPAKTQGVFVFDSAAVLKDLRIVHDLRIVDLPDEVSGTNEVSGTGRIYTVSFNGMSAAFVSDEPLE